MEDLAHAQARWLINSGWFDTLYGDHSAYQALCIVDPPNEFPDFADATRDLRGIGYQGIALVEGQYIITINPEGTVSIDGPLTDEYANYFLEALEDRMGGLVY